ncbi:HXXXD-type acyl-transferase family protein [Raphanus sativus]|uniref:BAHD acyltransferase At5g47980-like n=1 Tax=Raphanus sativus TaxID=3726 RepID=A0A6J0JQF7_RAPSA|nr:BAHD acyltransferase At5g47980-like [Raphanus sativus]KAJ4890771.1 HXXXD-type acyl-transferase family protein [Raphanus sativus]
MEKMSVETIKPPSATPQCLRTLPLSVVDYRMQPVYTYACLFYTNDPSIPRQETTKKLKTSLSQTLTSFYPFAGRVNGLAVDCNDEGVIFVEATLGNSTLSAFLNSPAPDSNDIQQTLLPLHCVPQTSEASVTWPLLLVKASYFQCGGMSLGICMSHKLADAASLSAFVRVWAATARGESGTVGKPEFAGINVFPPPPPPPNDASNVAETLRPKITGVTKRFVFSGSKIDELKANVEQTHKPTRVQCVTALLWRCVSANTKASTTKVLYQPANLRTKIPSLLSENLIGNLISTSMTLSRKGEEIQIQETVKELRERAEELTGLVQEENDVSAASLGSKLLGKMVNDYSKLSNEPGHSMYAVTSWCRMPFYEADFGKGCPVWVVGNVAPRLELVTMLLDSNDFKGIEAWVTLSEEDMVSFEQNSELLAFASPNPPVIF